VQPLHLFDDHQFRHHPSWIIGRQGADCLLEMLESHADVEPIKNWKLTDASIGENAPHSRAAVGEGSQHRVLGCSDSIEALADEDVDICIGSGNGAENLSPTGLRFNIALPYLQMPLAILTAASPSSLRSPPATQKVAAFNYWIVTGRRLNVTIVSAEPYMKRGLELMR
jgi:hypothetical protein